MAVWQYCRVSRNDIGGLKVMYFTGAGRENKDTSLDIEGLLGKLGEVGWELIAVPQSQDADWMFKREGREGAGVDALSI